MRQQSESPCKTWIPPRLTSSKRKGSNLFTSQQLFVEWRADETFKASRHLDSNNFRDSRWDRRTFLSPKVSLNTSSSDSHVLIHFFDRVTPRPHGVTTPCKGVSGEFDSHRRLFQACPLVVFLQRQDEPPDSGSVSLFRTWFLKDSINCD